MTQITTILQAVIEAQTKTTEGRTKGNGEMIKMKHNYNTNGNDMPNDQISKRHHPNRNSQFHSCGYDLSNKHDSNTWKWKKDGQKYEATIKRKIGGSERNFFHYTCKWQCGRIDKKLSSLNYVTCKPKYLNETLSNPSSSSNNNYKIRTKQLA